MAGVKDHMSLLSLYFRDDLVDGTRNSKSTAQGTLSLWTGLFSLFLRLVDTFFRYVNIVSQITPSALEGLGVPL